MKLQVLIDDQDKGSIELTGPGIIPYAGAVSSFCRIVADIYSVENPDSPDYLTIGGAEVSLKSRVRRPRPRRRQS